jgi:glutamyl-tRNA reductase
MAEAAARSLAQQAKALRICNRSFERAATLASQFHAGAAPMDQLEAELVMADVVVASTSSTAFVITHDLVRRVMKQRKGRTLFFIDIAVPRNIDPSIHTEIDNAYVYDVDDLESEVAENMKSRQSEVATAERIVNEEVAAWLTWARGLDVNPTIVAFRAKTRALLLAELERSLGARLRHLSEADRAALVQMMESATNKLLHGPTTRLKEAAGVGDGSDLVGVLQRLFDLSVAETSAVPPAEESASRLGALDGRDEHVRH